MLLKREDLNHTGSHKINNVVGQALLARRMGKQRLIAETGAGQHGVATATAAALFDMECVVYMGEVDMERQALNVFRMRLLGAEVRPALTGSRTLKDAVNEAMRDWVATVEQHPLLPRFGDGAAPVPVDGARAAARGRRRGPRPVPGAARARCRPGAPTTACPTWSWRASAAAPTPPASSPASPTRVPSWWASSRPAAPRWATACRAWCTGCSRTCCRTSSARCRKPSRSRPGLDYPGVGPEHAHLADTGRARYESVTDAEVLEAFQLLARTEGIIPALESAHALAWVSRERARSRAHRAGEPLGSGRQGRGAGRPDPRRAWRDGRRLTDARAVRPFEAHLRERRAQGRKLLVPYVTGGLGDPGSTWCAAYVDAGADAIEVGLPFSDPAMDGPTIQEASRWRWPVAPTRPTILDDLRRFDCPVPIVVMTYYNLVFRAGLRALRRRSWSSRGRPA